MSKALPRVWKKDNTNSMPRLEVMCDGTPCLEKTWSMNNLASCVDGIDCRNKNGLFGELINYDKDGVETRGRWEFLDKVHRNQIPGLF